MATIAHPDLHAGLTRVNLNHLFYFWAVGKSGSVTGAAATLGVSQPSVSEQIRALELRLGATLFRRAARGVTLTPAGERAMRYAEEIVGISRELLNALPLREEASTRTLAVGTADAVPKLVVRRLLASLLAEHPGTLIVCHEWRVEQLLAELSLHRLDMVISDLPLVHGSHAGMVSYSAGSSEMMLAASPAVARRYRRGFPRSLNGAPMLLPVVGSALRGTLDRWFALHSVTPRTVLEADDRSLLHHFAQDGHGLIAVATSNFPLVRKQFGLAPVRALRNVREEYYVMLVDRNRRHPVMATLQAQLSQRADGSAHRKKGRA